MRTKFIACLLISLIVMLPISLAQNYTYDANGNIISGLDLKYEYDGFNNLVRVNNTAGTVLEEYTYDDSGNRLIKYEPPSNTTTYYLDDNLVRIVNNSGTYDTFYYYDDQGNLLVRKDSDSSKFYYHPDHMGSTSLVTSSLGAVVEKTNYKPYGEVLSGGSDRFTFTGQELDDSGLMYYGARYYDPEIGKFTQPDTLLPDMYNPQALNRYSYTLNNPYKYVDPDGRSPALIVVAAVAFVVVGLIITAGKLILQDFRREFPPAENPGPTPSLTEDLISAGGSTVAPSVAEKAVVETAGTTSKVASKAVGKEVSKNTIKTAGRVLGPVLNVGLGLADAKETRDILYEYSEEEFNSKFPQYIEQRKQQIAQAFEDGDTQKEADMTNDPKFRVYEINHKDEE